jgi:flagellar biogenesis protein FliO
LPGGWAGWLLGRFNGGTKRTPRLALIERIALAPRQSLALVEAEGRRFLVATSADGAPAFCALDDSSACGTRNRSQRTIPRRERAAVTAPGRVSW